MAATRDEPAFADAPAAGRQSRALFRSGTGHAILGSIRKPWIGDFVSLGMLAALVLVSFRDAVTQGVIAFETDTVRFYYPLERWFAEHFKNGSFPLWNPQIFAGYPIFADGEKGLAHPLHLLLLSLLSVDQSFIWLRILHVFVAAAGMFA
ncbi:MAG: hypothetical protein HY534_05530, partial [Chloroflexi bacterium]|nr:hypothetical protein [Chloroflexota bacterium]